MWLFPELMRLPGPIILEGASPGTRVLASSWDLGAWQAHEINNDGTAVYMWIVPARIAGVGEWELSIARRRFRYSTLVEQQFQMVEGSRAPITAVKVSRECAAGRGHHLRVEHHPRSIGIDGARVQRQGRKR
jgi:hypothetical protein